jgi:hypothetical protein
MITPDTPGDSHVIILLITGEQGPGAAPAGVVAMCGAELLALAVPG